MQYSVDTSKMLNPEATYHEVAQKRPCLFSFAKVDGNIVYPLHKPVKCRDYLGDFLVWSTHPQLAGVVYGFDVYDESYDFSKAVFLMYNAEELHKNIKFLNEYETKIGVPLTKIVGVKGGKGKVVVFPDKWWMTNTLHLSWYTQMLRHLTYTLTSLTSNIEEQMIKIFYSSAYKNEHKIQFFNLPKLLKKLQFSQVSSIATTHLKNNMSSTHNANGFYSLLCQVNIFLSMGKDAREHSLKDTQYTYLRDVLNNVDILQGEI